MLFLEKPGEACTLRETDINGDSVMDKVKFGIIGTGNMGSAHATFISELSNCELTAVCDTNPEALKRVPAAILSRIRTFTDDEEFFRKSGVDAVIIAVPHYDHPSLAIRAMECGMNVIVEKPIAVHKAEAERLLNEAKKYPKLVKSAMFCQRMVNAHKKIKSLIDSGELGKITRVNWIITDWFRSQAYYDSGDWRASWRGEGGGVLLNQCPHQLDLMQWFFGMPNLVSASVSLGKFHNIEVEDEVNAYLEYPDGKTGNFIASTGELPGTNRLEVTCDRGKLVYEDGKLEFFRAEESVAGFTKDTKLAWGMPTVWKCEIPVSADMQHIHRDIIENTANAILHPGTKLFAPLEEGIRGLELGNAMLLSGLEHKPVKLPIDSAVYAKKLEKLIAGSRYVKKTAKTADKVEDFKKSF